MEGDFAWYNCGLIEFDTICRILSHCKHPGIVQIFEYECCWDDKYASDERSNNTDGSIGGG